MSRTTSWTIGNQTYTGSVDDMVRMLAENGSMSTCNACHGEGKVRVQAPVPGPKLSSVLVNAFVVAFRRLLKLVRACGAYAFDSWMVFPLALVIGTFAGIVFTRAVAFAAGVPAISPELVMGIGMAVGFFSFLAVVIEKTA